MSSEKFNFRAAVYLIMREKNKVLLIRRFNTGWMVCIPYQQATLTGMKQFK